MMLVDVFLLQSKRKEIVRVLPILLLLTFLFFFGCTSNGDVITIPFSESQFYSRTTDLNYVLFVSGYYDGNCLVIDNNKISVVDCGSGGGSGSSVGLTYNNKIVKDVNVDGTFYCDMNFVSGLLINSNC
jgi:hypothetical protein